MEFCDRYPRVAWARPELTPKRVLFTRLRCKQWSCEYCAKKNQSIWRAFLNEKLPQVSANWWFVTLTAHSRMRTQDASYKNLVKGIDTIMKRVRRVFGKVEYVRVYEKHPTSEALHAHFIISGLAPFLARSVRKNNTTGWKPRDDRQGYRGTWSIRTWFKKTAQECKVGYQVEVEGVENSYTVHYVTKYLTKTAQDITVKGLRHVQTSRGVGSPGVAAGLEWQVAGYATARDFVAGETLFDLQTMELVDADYWSEFEVYPPEMN